MKHSTIRFPMHRRLFLWPGLLLPSMLSLGCGGPAPLTADMPLHLEEHVDAATVVGSEVPANPPEPVEWRFDQPQPDWKLTPSRRSTIGAATLARTSEGLRVTLTNMRPPNGQLRGGIHVDLPDWDRSDWSDVVIRARADSASPVNMLGLGFGGQESPIVRDGTIQTYRLRADFDRGARPWLRTGRQLALYFGTDGEPGSIDLLSVSVVPVGAVYAEAPYGVRAVRIGDQIRRALFTHAPGHFSYRVRVPEGGRLDVGLGVLGDNVPVTFRVTVRRGGREEVLLEESHADPELWAQRSVDLSRYAGQTVTLALEAQAEQPGTVALWGAPTVSGARGSDRPNVIFYVIDGGWPDDMSVYGYNRRTTPNLERLAAEGALFEYAYSNTPRTSTSTPSFMTSLQSSVLGNTRQFPPIPDQVRTMAERFHAAGYQTAVFTSNPNAGSPSNLERGVDLMQDTDLGPEKPTSVVLHSNFWNWRDAFRGEPYWVHFQTTDVHGAELDRAPGFRGLYTTAERRREYYQEVKRLYQVRGSWGRTNSDHFQIAGIDRLGFMETVRGLYDESLAHQDYQIGRLVERLRERGEWEHTLLIVASDHGIEAVSNHIGFGGLLQDTLPAAWTRSLLRGSVTRVPLIFVWPGHIEGGRRFEAPVSMIDVLPTVLDLTGLPIPDVMQGQSLAPLLRGEPGWTPRPVIMDEFEADFQTGQLRGFLDVIDGRWGASMYIGPPLADSTEHRPWPVLLFDVWEDPWALHPINEQRPDLVERYTEFLEEQWKAHRMLAQRFTASGTVELTPEQLERLRALGYIR